MDIFYALSYEIAARRLSIVTMPKFYSGNTVLKIHFQKEHLVTMEARETRGTVVWHEKPYLRTSGREQVPCSYTWTSFFLSALLVPDSSATRVLAYPASWTAWITTTNLSYRLLSTVLLISLFSVIQLYVGSIPQLAGKTEMWSCRQAFLLTHI